MYVNVILTEHIIDIVYKHTLKRSASNQRFCFSITVILFCCETEIFDETVTLLIIKQGPVVQI